MFPSIDRVQTECEVSPQEADLLRSREAPIVLLARQSSPALGTPHSAIAASVAPGNPHLGMMLPSNPLHHLLLADLGFPVVATSGNRSDEPICTDEVEALARLGDIADLFLVHNRPIVRHVDDSIVRVILGEETILRRARGYAPLPVQMPDTKTAAPTILALGGHLKNTVALSVGRNVFIGQHLGDLETEQAHQAFRRATRDLPRLYSVEPDVIAADLHPDHLSTRHGESLVQASAQPGGPDTDATRADQHLSKAGSRAPRFVQVQHHIAHVLACLGENRVSLPAVGAAWDGTGYGRDGAIWGGEFFRVTGNQVERVAHLRPFRLPGGDAAIREPRRAALGLLSELAIPRGSLTGDPRRLMEQRFSATELATLEGMLSRRVNAPLCSSVGRLFDAVAALAGLRQRSRFEGQAAMELEFALDGVKTDEAYEFQLRETPKEPLVLDWENMIASLVADVQNGVAAGVISARFHNALAKAIVAVARRIGEPRLALSGGCFQNRHLTERAVLRLREAGFQPCWHHRVPPNDGGIAFGQAVAAQREIEIT